MVATLTDQGSGGRQTANGNGLAQRMAAPLTVHVPRAVCWSRLEPLPSASPGSYLADIYHP